MQPLSKTIVPRPTIAIGWRPTSEGQVFANETLRTCVSDDDPSPFFDRPTDLSSLAVCQIPDMPRLRHRDSCLDRSIRFFTRFHTLDLKTADDGINFRRACKTMWGSPSGLWKVGG